MKNCQKPTCVYSKLKKKCVKPNPYVQFISHCSKLGNLLEECKKEYKSKHNDITQNACYYYLENDKIGNISSCPKIRRPIADNCPQNYPILKPNKYNVKCCYKDIIKSNIPSISSNRHQVIKQPKDTNISSISKNPFDNLHKSENYLNKKLKKYYKPVYKYKNLQKPIKI